MRTVYAARRDAPVTALAAHAPGVAVTGLAAGFHAVAHLTPGTDEQTLIATARTRSVGLHGMSACRSTGACAPAQLVLGFGDLGERTLTAGIAAVGDLLGGPG
ncbi:hypothetical protein [Streptomyces sp. N2A]|uniref:hypothetical protein n=1 Tax=Streptomyces sp. N2A TaxID=3073936 RepID=UPI0028702316|nr:hypothetical protein [Streptomyces sp. N2A]